MGDEPEDGAYGCRINAGFDPSQGPFSVVVVPSGQCTEMDVAVAVDPSPKKKVGGDWER
jgi:hypothetical protein